MIKAVERRFPCYRRKLEVDAKLRRTIARADAAVRRHEVLSDAALTRLDKDDPALMVSLEHLMSLLSLDDREQRKSLD